MATDRDFRYDLRPSMQPFLLPVCAFAAGIAAAAAGDVPVAQACAVAVASILVAVAARATGARTAFPVFLIAVASLGCVRMAADREASADRPLRRLVDEGAIRPGDPVCLDGVLESPPEREPSRARLTVRVSSVRPADGRPREAAGRAIVRVTIAHAADAEALESQRLARGTPVRITGEAVDDLAFQNPGIETLRPRMRRAGIDLTVRADGALGLERLGPDSGGSVRRWLDDARRGGCDAIDRACAPRTAGVLRALLLGDGSGLDEETAEAYRRSGAFHVLVISGAHVALLSGLSVWLVGLVSRRPSVRLAAAAAPAWTYAILLGGPAPVVRAALAVSVAAMAPLVGRRATPPNTLALAAGVVLVADPGALADVSFRLTFAAVAGIVLVAAPVVERLADVGRWVPTRSNPYPPACAPAIRAVAELLFWDEREFRRRQTGAAVRFAPEKSTWGRFLSLLRIQAAVRRCLAGLWIALVVHQTLAPLAAASFGRSTIIGAPWALAVETLLGGALIAGLAFLAASAFVPSVAPSLAGIAEAIVDAAGAVALRAPAGWPAPAYLGWRRAVELAFPLLVAVAVLAISRWRPLPRAAGDLARSRWRALPRIAALALAAACASALALPHAEPRPDGLLHVCFLDVGQGDAAFVRFPDGTSMLVDAGGRPRFDAPLALEDGVPLRADGFDVGDRVVCASLLAQGTGRVDTIVASHGDIDHVGGFAAVLRRLNVGSVLLRNGIDDGELRTADAAALAGVPVRRVSAGEAFDVAGARVEVLWPEDSGPSGNDGSLVLRIVYGRRAFLLTGDIESDGERALLACAARRSWDLRADVLKVAHHGSRGSSTATFLWAVAPSWAVVSAPRRSPYGHPHPEALARLRSAGAVVLQTGLGGAVEFSTDGVSLTRARFSADGTQLLPP